jgi:hypothetical protein
MHHQAVLASVVLLQEPQRITAAAAVHPGTEAQVVGLALAVLAAAGAVRQELVQA